MYPNEQPQNYSIDYLNQIAPQAPKKQFDPKMRLIAIILGVATIVTILLVIVTSFTGGSKSDMQQLAARLATTEKLATDAQKNLKSSELRSLNGSLKILLTNTNRDIAEPLKNNGITVTKLDKAILAKEDGAQMIAALEDARLNATYDRTYAREMSYQLETIVLQMKELYASTSSSSLKTFLDTSYKNIQPVQKQFSELNASNA